MKNNTTRARGICQPVSKIRPACVNRFIKKSLPIFLIILISCGNGANRNLIHVSPESKGFSSSGLEKLEDHIKHSGSSALLILVDGDVIFDWGETKRKHTIHSMRKALLSSLYGIAIERGQIDTSMTLRELHIDDIEPSLTDAERNARIADLLKSRSGVYHHAAGVSKGMLRGKPARNTHKSGEYFYYNNWDFNVLGSILEQKTGQSLYELFKSEIADPLGMHDYKGKYCSIDGESDDVDIPDTDGFYQYEKSKSKYPAYHFRMSARDLALYGQLYLNGGIWGEKQIISEEWIDMSTKAYSEYNPEYGIGYGMLWYVTGDSFYHTGLGVHMLAVYPDSKMVLVHRVDTENDFNYNNGDLYKMIGLVFDSKND